MNRNKTVEKRKKRNRERRHSLRFWMSIAAAVLFTVVALVLILLPFFVEWTGERYLTRAGARSAVITNVDINLLTGRLTVFGLQVEGPNGDRISFEKFETDADVLLLFKKRVRISEASLVGLTADIRQLGDGTLMFGGLQAPASTVPPPITDEKKPASWGIGFGIVDLYDLQADIITNELKETVIINRLRLRDFSTWAPDSLTDILIRASILGADVQLEGTVSPLAAEPRADIRYNIRELSVARLNPYLGKKSLSTLTGDVYGRGELRLSLTPGSRNLDLRTSLTSGEMNAMLDRGSDPIVWEHEGLSFQVEGKYTDTAPQADDPAGAAHSRALEFAITVDLEGGRVNLAAGENQVDLGQKALNLQVKGSYSDTGTLSPDNILTDANLTIEEIRVLEGKEKNRLISVGSVQVKDLVATGAGQIKVDQASLNDIFLLSRPEKAVGKGEPAEVVQLDSVTVTGINLENRHLLHVKNVNLDSLLVWILRGKGGELEPANLLSGFSGDDLDKPTEEHSGGVEKSEPYVDISVDRVLLSGDNSFTFRDLDVQPPMTFQVDSFEMEVSELDTNSTDGHATILLKADMGKYSTFRVEGRVYAPWAEPDLDLHVQLQTLDLPPLTPYTDRYVGYILKSGHLDTDLDIVIRKGSLNVQTEVVVNRIEMNPVKEENEQRASERLGIPVKMALSLLKDKNDDIKLSLPIEGDLNDPEFKLSDIVLKVTGNALKKGVSAFYGPLGATLLTGGLLPPGTFSVLGKVFEGATTVSFDPIVFDPLESGLSGGHALFLGQLADKLSEKPDTRLILCGKVTHRDIVAMRDRDFVALPAAGSSAPAGTIPPTAVETPVIQQQAPMAADVDTAESSTSLEVPQSGPPSIEEVPLTDEEKERLIELAKQRALAVKDHLIQTGGLDPERLFVCYSDVEKEEGGPPPRVDLSI